MNTGANFPSGDPIDPQGRLSPQWRAFFLALFSRSGGVSGNDTTALQAAITVANAKISDLQADSSEGVAQSDMAAVFSMIHAVETIAAQAMAASSRQADERGESGDGASLSGLMQRISDLESRIECMQPVIADASQLTGLGTMSTQDAGAVAVTGGTLNGVTLGGTSAVTLSGTAGNVGFPGAPVANTEVHVGMGALTGSTITGAQVDGTIPATATSVTQSFRSAPSTAVAAFTLGNLYHFRASLGTIGAGSAITNNLGFYADTSITGGTLNCGFRGDVPVATGNWNLYMNSGAANYMNGVLQIGTPTNDGSGNKLQVNTGISISPSTTTTAPAAGAAGALPATPTGYATFRIGGTDRKIAYY